jgi:hypothetical protein
MHRAMTGVLIASLTFAAALAASCGGEDSPSGPTSVTSAPAIVSPADGSTIEDRQPTLVVSNVGVDGATYHFQVGTEDGFENIVAQQEGVPQGSGQTSWQVTVPLENRTYFWRARAQSGGTPGPFSSATEFTINGPGFGSKTPINGLYIYDPLTNGMTIGVREGGQFTDRGWQVMTRSDYIRYNVPTLQSGFVEWENSNMEDEVPEKQWMLFGMWDPTRGEFRDNPFRVSLQKLDAGHASPYFRIRWISDGEQYDFGNDFEEWDLFHTYTIRVEWGDGVGSQIVRIFLDGQLQFSQNYDNLYRPATHWIEMGIKERKESIIGIIYANVKIGAR